MKKIQSLSKQASKQASKQVEIIGCMDNTMDNTFESANRVYDTDGLSPTINTCGGGGLQPKIVEVQKVDVNELGFIEHGTGKHQSNTVFGTDGISPTITTIQGGGTQQIKIIEQQIVAYDEQNKCIRDDVFGTLTTDGSSPKHNNRVIESKKIKIRQATKDGFVDCEIGGGGGFGISIIGHTQRKSDKKRKDMSDTDNGEYP
jgi:hypothetical protein